MKQRLCAIILVLSMICILPGGIVSTQAFSQAIEEKLLIDALIGEEAVEDESPLTRGEFVLLMTKLTKTLYNGKTESVFSDVPADSKYAAAVSFALSQGWISSGENFEPERPITPNEAIKIAVCIIGREIEAQKKGGYPTGYIAAAISQNMTKGWDVGAQTISKDDFYKLAFSMMKAEILTPSILGTGETTYENNANTLLHRLHQVDEAYGIITRTTYSSYNKDDDIEPHGVVGINGVDFNYDAELDEKYLGLNCRVYFREEGGERTLISLYPYANEEIIILREDIDTAFGDVVRYYDENNKIRKASLKSGYLMIYNGRLCDTDETLVKGSSGSIRLLDNNNDGKYDLMFIDAPHYMTLQNYDSTNYVLVDANDKAYNVELEDSYIKNMMSYPAADLNFAQMKGQVIAVWQSYDKKLTRLQLCQESVSGIIDYVDNENKIVSIEGTEYKYSTYLEILAKNQLRPGAEISCVLGAYGELAALSQTASAWQYGYIVASGTKNSIKSTVQVKIFSEESNMVILDLAKKVKVDGGSAVAAATVKASLTPQLVRYYTNRDGEISAIDFAQNSSQIEKDLPENNKLICNYKNLSSQYKSNSVAFVTNMNVTVERAKVFMLPTDLSVEEDFQAGSYDVLISGKTHTIKGVYNLDDYNSCEAIVVEMPDNSSLLDRSKSYLIEYIKYTTNEDGETGRNLYCWSTAGYETLFLPDSVNFSKDSGTDLCGGDVIRVNMKGNEISDIVVDLDFSGGTVKQNKNSGGLEFDTADDDIGYSAGRVYSMKEGYLNIIPYGTTDTAFTNRKSYFSSTTNIVRYNPEEKKAYPIAMEDIRSMKLYGERADYVLMRQTEYSCTCIFVYEGGVTE